MPLFLIRCQLLLCASILLTGCIPSTPFADTGLIQSRAWRMDPTGQETLQDVETATDWQALPEWKAWGFGPETVWVRLQLKAAASGPQTQESPAQWAVRVRPPILDYVTLYDPTSGRVLRTGDALPPDGEDLASIIFTLQIPALPHERTIYLQMRSTSARTLHVEVLPYGQAQQMNRLQEWLMGFVGAASAIFALWAWAQWWLTRENVIFAFAIKQVLATAWAFFYTGFARVVIGSGLPEGVLTTVASTVFVWVVGVSFWFFSVLIQGYKPWRPALQAVRLLSALILVLPVVQWFGSVHTMLVVANSSVLVCFAMLLFTLATAMKRGVPQAIPSPVLMAYFLVYSLLNSLPVLMYLGWIEARPIVLFGMLAHAVLDGLVMFVMLQIRARTMRQEQMQTVLDLQRSQQQAEAEKRHREEQSQLFAMLAHEMKTPLATLRMWMETGQLRPETMERAIADMNSVIERCVHTGQLADQGLQPDWQSVDPVALTRSCIQSCRSPERVELETAPAQKPFARGGALLQDAALWEAAPAAECFVGGTPVHEYEELQTDAQMLSIVLGNLLDNACKYGAPGSRIRLTLTPSMWNGLPGWLWQVDNEAGPAGLPEPERLFEKYYRSPRARRLSGSGLGLFLVKGLLDLMQGSIRYETREGHAVFSVWLPLQPR